MQLLAISFFVATQVLTPVKTTYTIKIGGSNVGKSEFSVDSKGVVLSTSKLEVGSLVMDSRIEGQFENGKLKTYSLKQTGQPQSLDWVFADGKLKGKRGDTAFDVPLVMPSELFGNLHPGFTSWMLKKYDPSKGGKQKITAFIVDGGGGLPCEVERTGVRDIKRGSAKEAALVWQVSSGALKFELVTDKDLTILGENVPSQSLMIVADGFADLFVDPLAKYPELSPPTLAAGKIVRGEKAAMRDGIHLVHDRIGPEKEGKYPVILTRTPYGRGPQMVQGEFYAKRGYIFISQDCRGREESEGEWDPFTSERNDGFDTVEWIAKQPWCDGNVGMIGGSYGGAVQWQAAVEQPKALKCIIPQVSPPDAFTNLPYEYGAFTLYQNVWWATIVKEKKTNMPSNLQSATVPNADLFLTLPLSKVDDKVLGQNVPFFDKWLERESIKDFKGFDQLQDLGRVKIPALHISGWWDGDGIGTKLNWEALRAAGRKNQWLIYGPWTHAFNTTSALGDVDYGPGAILELDSVYLRWFDTWLKGKDVGQAKVPKVKIFQMGPNVWLTGSDWPLPSTISKTLFLSSSGPANGKSSLGSLSDSPKATDPDQYLYNPASVVLPKVFKGTEIETTTKTELDDGDSYLYYKSNPFPAGLDIFGPIQVDLSFSTSARDADLFVTLVDIDEKGGLRGFGMPGKLRASYVGGNGKRQLVTPGKVYRATLRPWDTAYRLDNGHRLGLIINSDMFPMVSRNLGTGEPIKDATRMVSSVQTIYHDPKRPSSVTFYTSKPK